MKYKTGVGLCLLALLLVALDVAAEEARFDVLEFAVEGNTALPRGTIEMAVYPYLGEQRTIKDVEQARTNLEKAYQAAGYLTVFVDIPEQQVNTGVVRLRVTEGQVERVRVSGSRYYSLGRIKAVTAELEEGSVPHFPEVQKQLAAVNRSPDRRVTPVLRQGRTPGKVEVELKVDDKLPLHGSVELNDRYSADTSRTRLSANLRYDNLWQREHSFGVSVQTAPENPSESKVLVLNYLAPVGSAYLAGYGVVSRSDVATVGDINVLGNGHIVGLRYVLPLRAQPDLFHTFTLGVDYKDFAETVQVLGADGQSTPITYMPFSLGYDATWQGAQATTQLVLGFNFSVRGLGNDPDEFALKRFGAQSNYAYLRADLKHTRAFASEWSLQSKLGGQLSSQPLISNEQFSAGGADSVRGYLESSALGDDGYNYSLEFRSPSLAKAFSPQLGELTAYGFAEGATLRVREALPGQTDRFNLLAAGLGMRFKGWDGIFGNLDVAYPFKDAGRVKAGDTRLHFRVGYEW